MHTVSEKNRRCLVGDYASVSDVGVVSAFRAKLIGRYPACRGIK